MTTTQQVLDFLKTSDPSQLAKVQAALGKNLTAGDVHQPTALGNETPPKKGKGRARRQKPVSSTEGTDPHKEGAPGRSGTPQGDPDQVGKDAGDDVNPTKDVSTMKEKSEVGYTDHSTTDDQCGNCVFLLGQDACKRVKGVVALTGWCELHEPELVYDKDVPLVRKKDAPRQLKMFDDQHAHSPFPWDASALGQLRPDQVPRFLSAITNPELLDKKVIPLRKLTALQNRVDMAKVEKIQEKGTTGDHVKKDPVVVKVAKGKRLIADGHHRLTAHWLDGDNKAEVRYVDISDPDEALTAYDPDKLKGDTDDTGDPVDKSSDFEALYVKKTSDVQQRVWKADPEQKRIWGWASIAQIGDEVIVDKQGDIIPIEELDKAAHDFMRDFRDMGDMHERVGMGRAICSFVFTPEWEARGVFAKTEDGRSIYGWMIGFQVDDDALWADIKLGKRPEFSIGGRGRRVDV